MNNIELTRLHNNELALFAHSLFHSLHDRKEIEKYVIKRWGGTLRYVAPPDGMTLLGTVEQHNPSLGLYALSGRPEYCYITYEESLYLDKNYKHSDFNISEDFFSMSTMYDMQVLKVLYFSEYIKKELTKDKEQMVLINIVMIENYYQYLMTEYGNAY